MQTVALIDNTAARSAYQALSVGEIRVLLVHPSEAFDSSIECTLSTQKPSDGEYSALSYVWGDTEDTIRIIVNGLAYQVTRNLEAALRQLRHPKYVNALWVDAICINQHDSNERSDQVRNMHAIYLYADEVLVWLGIGDAMSDRAIGFLEGWAAQLKNAGIHNHADYQSWAGAPAAHRMTALVTGAPAHVIASLKVIENWDALKVFLERPWWMRLWVFQEAVLAQKATLHCGSRSTPWDTVAAINILHFLARGLKGRFFPPDHPIWSTKAHAALIEHRGLADRARRILPPHSLPSKDWNLYNILWELAVRPCSDPRDKLFSLVGLMGRTDLVAVDYGKTAENVYKDFARDQVLYWTPSLAILRFAGVGSRTVSSSVPSWVPDWRLITKKSAHTPLSFQPLGPGSAVLLAPAATVSDSGDCLTLRGVEFDKVAAVENERNETEIGSAGFELLSREPTLYPTGCSEFYALIRTRLEDSLGFISSVHYFREERRQEIFSFLLGAWTWFCSDQGHEVFDKRLAVRREGETQAAANARFTEAISRIRLEDIPTRIGRGAVFPVSYDRHTTAQNAIDEWPKDLELTQNITRYSITWRSLVADHTEQQCLFRTEKGYFGSGPRYTKPGDIVCVLMGGEMLYLLRRRANGDGYVFVGETYVHGIMDGEAPAAVGIDLRSVPGVIRPSGNDRREYVLSHPSIDDFIIY